MVRYLFYTIGDLTYQSPLVFTAHVGVALTNKTFTQEVQLSLYMPGQTVRTAGVEASRISRQYAPAAFTPQEIPLYSEGAHFTV